MEKIKTIRKIVNKFSAMGNRFFIDDIVIINNNDVFLIYKEKDGMISVLRNYDTGNNVIEKILDNSQDTEWSWSKRFVWS